MKEHNEPISQLLVATYARLASNQVLRLSFWCLIYIGNVSTISKYSNYNSKILAIGRKDV